MSCETNNKLPQLIDIEALRSGELPPPPPPPPPSPKEQMKVVLNEAETSNVYSIIPQSIYGYRYLRSLLSTKKNKYLEDKWSKWLDSRQERCTYLYQYIDLLNCQRKMPTKPMKLNGNFYDFDNKLAPTPFVPNARGGPIKSNVHRGRRI